MARKHSKETIEVVRAAMALAQRDVDLGLATLAEIAAIPRTRFAPVERKKIAKALINGGMSERKIAKELGVDRRTVRRDIGKPRRTKATTKGTNATIQDADATARAAHLKTAFLHRADLAAQYVVYEGKIDVEICRATRATALAWDDLATKMERGNA